jgi:hypothetical protein
MAQVFDDHDETELGFPGFADAQIGAIAEDRLATAILIDSHGLTAIGYPVLDLGFDLYPRRHRSLRVRPTQVKARTFLASDGQFQVSVASLRPDPNSTVLLPYLPPPTWQLAPRLWAIPTPDFMELAVRNGDGSYLFSGYPDGRFPAPANRFLVDSDHLQRQWLSALPRWNDPVPLPALDEVTRMLPRVDRAAARAFGRSSELWLMGQIMRASLQDVVAVQDRLRVDCVDLVLHDLRNYRVGGLNVHASTVNHRGIVEFRIRHRTFFTDPRLHVVVLPYAADGSIAGRSFVIPSEDIPRVTTASSDRGDGGYQGSFRLDPIAERFRPFACETAAIGQTVLSTLFP